MTIDSMLPRAHEWQMLAGFNLTVSDSHDDCLLEPVVLALEPLGLHDALLCEISRAVEQAGEDLRANCPTGSLDAVSVRVQVSKHAMHSVATHAPWQFFVIKQMASSESDVLDAQEHPRCFIDLHIY